MAKYFSSESAWTMFLLVALMLSLLVDAAGRQGGRAGRRRRNKRGNDKCSSSSVAEYKLTFFGTWSSEKFPKMYPRYRPPAQWSKLVGRSHGPNYHMWTLGEMADPALKRFAEEGDSLLYDSQPQGYQGIFDSFYAEPITGGEGRTSTFILADGAHSKVSFVVKMVPSPDWFVGIDGLELCRRGRWRARAHVNLRPMDAGTDRGYTFTSPNWPSHPRESIYKITSSYPNHPASAFLYPEYRRLPRVAYVQIQRVSQYFRKGAVSALKTNPGANLVVFGESASKKTTTVTIPNTTLTTQKAKEETKNIKDTTEAPVSTTINILGKVSTTKAASVEQTAGYAAAYTLLRTQLEQKPHSDNSSSVTTVLTSVVKSSIPAENPKPAPIWYTTTQAVLEEERGKTPKPGPRAYQHDDTMNRESLPAWPNQDDENGSPHKADAVVDGNVDDLNKQEIIATGVNGDKRLNKEAPSSQSFTIVESTSAQMASKAPTPSEATDHHSRQVDSISGEKDEESFTSSISLEALPSTSRPSEKLDSPSSLQALRNLSSRMNEKDTPNLRSSQVSSNGHAMGSTSTETIDQTKGRGSVPEFRGGKPGTIVRRLKLKSNKPRYRFGIGSSATSDREVPHPAEQANSQSGRSSGISEGDSLKGPEDCSVNEWSEWSPCSRTCGFGVRTRSRDILSHSRNGGQACPILDQEVLCGSMRNCRWNHFSFLSGSKRPRRTRRRRHHNDRHRTHAQERRRYKY